MPNQLQTNDIMAEFVAATFVNTNKAVYCADMPFNDDFSKDINGYNVGNTLTYRKPNYTNIRTGLVAEPQSLIERTETITLDQPIGADWNPNLYELTTDMASNAKIYKRFVEPSIIKLSNKVDQTLTDALETSVYNVVDNAGSGVNSFSVFNEAAKYLDKFGVVGDKKALMNIDDAVTLQNSVSNFFNTTINEEVGIKGMLGQLAGVDVFEDQNIGTHTNGSFDGAPITVKTSVVSGANTIVLTGFTPSATGVLNKGDIITVANVFAVNPVSLSAIGAGSKNLANFIIQETVDADGSGDATVTISPVITFEPTSPYNNVSKLPAAADAVSLRGGAGATYSNNYIFVKDGILLAIKPYFKPVGVEKSVVGTYADDETGLSFSVVSWFNGGTFTNLTRADILFGYKIQPEYIVRLIG